MKNPNRNWNMKWNSWIIGWVKIKFHFMLKKTELVIFKPPKKYFLMKPKLNLLDNGCFISRLTSLFRFSSNSIKYLGVKTDKFLHWHIQVNDIAVKLDRAIALLIKISYVRIEIFILKSYVKIKTLRNIYFEIFDFHLIIPLLIDWLIDWWLIDWYS